jgi:hypothetical protein
MIKQRKKRPNLKDVAKKPFGYTKPCDSASTSLVRIKLSPVHLASHAVRDVASNVCKDASLLRLFAG